MCAMPIRHNYSEASSATTPGVRLGEARIMPVRHRDYSTIILEFQGGAFLRSRQYYESQHMNRLDGKLVSISGAALGVGAAAV